VRRFAELLVQIGRQLLDLADPIPGRNRRQHRLGEAGAEQLGLLASHHLLQERHVLRKVLHHVFKQPAAEVDGELEIRVLMQHPQEGAVATHVRVVQHAFEITHGLVRVHP